MEVTGSDVTVSKTASAAFPRQTTPMRELPLLQHRQYDYRRQMRWPFQFSGDLRLKIVFGWHYSGNGYFGYLIPG
jgi:hypothetical protein